MIQDFRDEYARYRTIGEKALAQVPDEALNEILAPDGNSIAMLVRHLSGNLRSRFTDFLESDGEKPWRERDEEFRDRTYSRSEVDALWADGWGVLERALGALADEQFSRTVTIRGQPLTVHQALCRSVTHTAYHVGQLVLLARVYAAGDWKWISIPKHRSQEYNRNPTMEKRPT
jgi:uncharacterized damage-inducible protein DinB